MSDKYAIASGNFNDPAIWSDYNGGPGGAAVPTTGEDIYLNRSVTITDFYSPNAAKRNVFVAEGVDCSVAPFTVSSIYFGNGKKLTVDGTLRLIDELTGTNKYISALASGGGVVIGRNGRLFLKPEVGTAWKIYQDPLGTSSVENDGIVTGGQISTYFAPEPCGTLRPGVVDAIETLNSASVPEGVRTISGDFETLLFYVRNGSANVKLSVLSGKAKIGVLRYQFSNASGRLLLEQFGDWELSGDAVRVSNAGSLEWRVLDGATSTFTGTADQTIDMPDGVTGQTWIVDKPAGKLDLTRFEGFLQGRVRDLVVRSSSSIDLSGPSPQLATTDSHDSFHGLKADAIRPDRSAEGLTLFEHLLEAMDSCENYGSITIPVGKTICTKKFVNRSGARLSGSGTLCVRYGALTDWGTIDPEIVIRYFDYPIGASFWTPPTVYAGAVHFVRIDDVPGCRFRMDWGDGNFSERESGGELQHVYATANWSTVTLTLTAVNPDGTVATSSQTIAFELSETSTVYGPVETEPRRRYAGVSRGNMPFPYRYTLAQGKSYMPDTFQLFCPMNEAGRALENGSGLYLARIAHADGRPVDPEEIASARYTIFRLDDSDASVRTPVEGHVDVPLVIDDVLLSEPIMDDNWTFDALGYNFHHIPDDTTYVPFPVAGRNYLVAYELRLANAVPKIQIQYRVRVH